MGNFYRSLLLLLITSLLLSACGAEAGLWGTASTPTTSAPAPFDPPAILPVTPLPQATPLVVLPLPGTPTPGMAAGRALLETKSSPALPVESQTAAPTLPPVNQSGPMDVYQSQGGDTLNIISARFGVAPQKIVANIVLPPADSLIPPGTLLLLPQTSALFQYSPRERTIPDSDVVYGPSALDFDLTAYIRDHDGYLNNYREYILSGGWTTGAQAVERIAIENSLNPRMILAIIEYESHWVRGQPTNLADDDYPLGYVDYHYRGLFRQLMWASGTLSAGYYGWRSGLLTELTFRDGSKLRLDPHLNAGTAALQYYFSKTHDRAEWEQIVAVTGFPALYTDMYGLPWQRAHNFEPTLPTGLQQPALSLPFEPGKMWALTGGPHSAWEEEGAMAALDFAPGSTEQGCVKSDAWVVAPADGVVARTANGVVILDLDGDGQEQTGWNILFLHIADQGKVKAGAVLKKDDKIGHPSCQGGVATGTHLHIARKYNGEWILADGPLAFNLDGWIAHSSGIPYKGTLTKGDLIVTACTCSTFDTRIIREK